MTALAVDRPTPKRSGHQFSFPVAASSKIYAGSLVCINASSLAVKGSAATGLKCVGVAQEQADNTSGADSAINVPVERGTWRFGNSAAGDAIALKDIGASCYIVDDQTVALTNGSSTRSVAGTIRDVDASGVWVEF
jgi:hypothetical protein